MRITISAPDGDASGDLEDWVLAIYRAVDNQCKWRIREEVKRLDAMRKEEET